MRPPQGTPNSRITVRKAAQFTNHGKKKLKFTIHGRKKRQFTDHGNNPQIANHCKKILPNRNINGHLLAAYQS